MSLHGASKLSVTIVWTVGDLSISLRACTHVRAIAAPVDDKNYSLIQIQAVTTLASWLGFSLINFYKDTVLLRISILSGLEILSFTLFFVTLGLLYFSRQTKKYRQNFKSTILLSVSLGIRSSHILILFYCKVFILFLLRLFGQDFVAIFELPTSDKPSTL